uniref:PDZ domain-containing protein n=1 Tax=Astatotilapia calliptera TaxID=8154 RepID=A0A3P8RG83_ASTCA
MTTKRKLIGRLVPCRCFRGEEEVISVLDYSHCSLQQVPKEIFSFERTLEELYLDANQIEELPKQLFNCQALKKLSMPDNDLSNLPTTIASLVNLKELDISKNGIQEFPDNIKCCKGLSVVEASVNPITKLPDGFTQLLNLTQLFLNDAFLEYLPANFGSGFFPLRSIHRLTQLERLDLGSNEFSEVPEVLEQIHNLKELWLDNNSLQTIPGSIGKLRQLRYLDLAKNRIETLDADISGCEALEDLLLSSNMLQHLPDSIGMLKKLTTLKVDDNQLTSLPNTIGSLSLLEELDCSCNELESLPPTIGYLHSLRTFAADENFLSELPREIGNCKNVTVMSLRSNKLEFLPDEIGQMTKLRVLNLSDNRLKNLPFTFTKLKDLAALWLSDNQSKALIPLQTEAHPETKQKVLTNYMFPQQPRHDEDYQSDSDSFNPTLWEEQRQQRMTVAFDFEDKKEEEDNSGKVKVEINLKRYPTPYPEDLKNMVKSVQSLVGKSVHAGHAEAAFSSLLYMPDAFFPLLPQDSMGGSPNDIRISDMRPTLVEPPMYKPKVVLLGKDKKESTDEEVDKLHCLNHSGSSGSSGSSNPLAQSFPKPIDSKPLLSQRETPPSGTLQQRGDRRPLSEPFDWVDAPHYDNTGFDAEESSLDPPSSTTSQGNPPLGSKPRSSSTHGRRPLLRQDRIVGVPLELDTQTLPFHGNQRPNQDNDSQSSGHPSQNPWQNWTRTPSPLEDRTAFPSKLDLTPTSSPNPDRKDMDPSTVPLPGSWTYHDNEGEQNRKDQLSVGGVNKVTVVMSKSSDRLSPMMKETRSKFKKSQSIDEIDIGSYKVYSIPMDSYSSSIEQQTSLDRPELPGSMEQTNMSRSQSAPMLDEEMGYPGHGSGDQNQRQNQKPAIPQKAYHFDHNYNPQVRWSCEPLVTMDRRVPPPFPNTPDYVNHSSKALEYLNQPGKTLPKELVSPRYRAYPPLEMFSFPQSPINQDGPPSQQQQPIPSQRSRPGFLRRADSLVSSTELALFRRVHEAQQEALQESQYRQQHSAMSNMADNQSQMLHNKRNGRYDDDYPTYQEQKKPMIGYPTKSLTQRRPLSARSYSTETYGASQARPVSARPTMAALLEKMPPDYTLATCPEKPPDDTIKVRPVVPQKPEDITSKMPADWRQQLLRHIEAKRLDRSGVLKHNTLTLGMLCQGGGHGQGRSSTLNFNLYNNTKHEPSAGRWLPLPPPPSTPSQQGGVLDNDQEGVSGSNQWAPYSLGRRDVPPDNLLKKVRPVHISGMGHSNQVVMTTHTNPRPQSARCLLQTKGQKSTDGFQEQLCVRIEKNPGLGFSISGGISGQGNPFKPSDMGIFVTRVQHDGPAASALQPGDKILQVTPQGCSHPTESLC